jgi:hypothetical protein
LFTLAAGDVDNDTKPDFVAGINNGPGDIVVGYGDGDGGVRTTMALGVGPPTDLQLVDVDGDGTLDLVATGAGTNSGFDVLLGNCCGGFMPAITTNVGFQLSRTYAADFDRDGKPDAVASPFSGGASFLHGLGNGSFGSPTALPGMHHGYVRAFDLNQDGKLDLVFAEGSTGVGVLLGLGNGGFTDQGLFTAVMEAKAVASGDFDSDGHPDLVVIDENASKAQVMLTRCHP